MALDIQEDNTLRFCVLASGSKANATYVDNKHGALLIDCGLSSTDCLARLAGLDLDSSRLNGIILTHEHLDHIRGVELLAKKLNIPVLTSYKTWKKAKLKGEVLRLQAEQSLCFAGFTIRPFSVSHDAVDPLAVVLEAEGERLGYCTDLGQVNTALYDNLQGCTALILESNHDPDLLSRGPYPGWLKQRVGSIKGHLSNQSALDLLERLWQPALRLVVAAHISQVNNSLELLKKQWRKRLAGFAMPMEMMVALQHGGLPVVDLTTVTGDITNG